MTTMEMIRNLLDIKNTEPEPDLDEPIKDLFMYDPDDNNPDSAVAIARAVASRLKAIETIREIREGKRPYKSPLEKISATLLSEEISRIREEQRRQAIEDLLDDLFEDRRGYPFQSESDEENFFCEM